MRLGQDLPALKSDDRVVITEFSESQEKERMSRKSLLMVHCKTKK